ncbi:hypothetical protein MHEC_28240 [Mycobacterium heckeshornense]|uniref:HTH tetR-type domain-containing protein n=2 Tax=Mycobacterium heckeshornense TaxID=110505 RepID=A0A7R7GUY4_9MYCO|nr:hypothetical protein MHEC_28240 [Mycobacterium heckeshornense]
MSAEQALQGKRTGTQGSVRARRSPQEVEQVIFDAARRLFAFQGYAATTIREIAGLAGVHVPLLYRRYGSKAGLFRAAVLVPFGEVISSYLKTWEAQIDEPVSLRELVVAFIDPLYALLREHRELAMALVQARALLPEGDTDGDYDNAAWPLGLGEVLAQLVPQLELEGARRGLRVDRSTTIFVVLGMVLGLALLDPVLGVGAVQATPDQVSEAMVELVLHGISPPDEALADVPADAPVSAQVLLALHERVVAAERRAASAEFTLAQYVNKFKKLGDVSRPP